jgi:hypothetical protein
MLRSKVSQNEKKNKQVFPLLFLDQHCCPSVYILSVFPFLVLGLFHFSGSLLTFPMCISRFMFNYNCFYTFYQHYLFLHPPLCLFDLSYLSDFLSFHAHKSCLILCYPNICVHSGVTSLGWLRLCNMLRFFLCVEAWTVSCTFEYYVIEY